MARLWTYARVCPVFSANDATCQLEVRSQNNTQSGTKEHMLQLEIPYSDGSNANGNGGNVNGNGAGDLTNRGAYRGLFNGKIFIPSAPQEEIYHEFDHYVDGYTIYGGSKYKERGLIPRLIGGLFKRLRQKSAKAEAAGRTDYSYRVSVKCLEVYNDQGFDLLRTEEEERPILKVDLFQSSPHLAEKHCQTEPEALDCVFLAAVNRSDAKTRNNANSSRSHAIFTVILTQSEGDAVTTSKLHLVDLAGSERVYKNADGGVSEHLHGTMRGGGGGGMNGLSSLNKSWNSGRILEARSINKSLHFLEQVVVAMQSGNNKGRNTPTPSFVPFRNSLMTFLLKEALVGNCKTSLIATISPLVTNAQETISTIRFAQRCSTLVLDKEARPERVVDYRQKSRRLEEENSKLQEQVAELQELTRTLKEGELQRAMEGMQGTMGRSRGSSMMMENGGNSSINGGNSMKSSMLIDGDESDLKSDFNLNKVEHSEVGRGSQELRGGGVESETELVVEEIEPQRIGSLLKTFSTGTRPRSNSRIGEQQQQQLDNGGMLSGMRQKQHQQAAGVERVERAESSGIGFGSVSSTTTSKYFYYGEPRGNRTLNSSPGVPQLVQAHPQDSRNATDSESLATSSAAVAAQSTFRVKPSYNNNNNTSSSSQEQIKRKNITIEVPRLAPDRRISTPSAPGVISGLATPSAPGLSGYASAISSIAPVPGTMLGSPTAINTGITGSSLFNMHAQQSVPQPHAVPTPVSTAGPNAFVYQTSFPPNSNGNSNGHVTRPSPVPHSSYNNQPDTQLS